MPARIDAPLRTNKLHQVPEPVPGEFYPAWVARLSVLNGLEPYRFLRWIGFRGASGSDLVYPPDTQVRMLSNLTGVPVNTLREMTCWPESEMSTYYPFSERKEHGDLVIPAPFPPSDRVALAQHCVECLREDDTYHLRKIWRMAYVVRCPYHRIPLLNRCPRCTAPLDPFIRGPQPIAQFGSNLFLRCSQCGHHLLTQDPPALHTETPTTQISLQLTHQILRAAKEGWYPLPGFGPIPTLLFLPGLRVILRILSSRFGMEWRMWIADASGLEPRSPTDFQDVSLKYFERLTGPTRERLLAEAAYLIDDWPNHFIESIRASGLQGSFVLEQRARRLPFWLLAGIQDPLCRLRFPDAPIQEPKPQPSQEVALERTFHRRSNTIEKITFIKEHPEWSEDIPQLGRAMVDFGLYDPEHSPSKIQKACRAHLALISRLSRQKSSNQRASTITGFRSRLVAQRRFLLAFKMAIQKRIGL